MSSNGSGEHSGGWIDLALFEKNLPLFKDGLEARDKLSSPDAAGLDRSETAALRKKSRLGEEAWMEVSEKAKWVIAKAVRTEMSRPRSFHVYLDEEDLWQVGYEAVWKMMRAADLSKMKSPVNYLMMWVNTMVKRAASKEEAEFGLAVSQVDRLKLIAAVREKLAKEKGSSPTDEEVYEALHSDSTRLKNMYGRLGADVKKMAPRNVTMEDVVEQGKINAGSPMRFAVNEDDLHEGELKTAAAEAKFEDDLTEQWRRAFWQAWMQKMRISRDQWDKIAASMGFYQTIGSGKTKKSNRLADEVAVLLASETSGVRDLSREWTREYGDGPWSLFGDVELGPPVSLDCVDESTGKKVFRTIKFDRLPADGSDDGGADR